MGLYARFVFPYLCDLATRPFEDDRREVIASAAGRVLEIGVGVGRNLPHYSAAASEVVGIEVSQAMLEKTAQRIIRLREGGTALPSIDLRLADATELPFGDGEFDAVISFLVFCSLPKPDLTAAEIFRVLRPGGRVHVFEHVAARAPRLRKWQDRLNPIWNRVSCGCNLNRDTRAVFQRAGFDCSALNQVVRDDSLSVTGPKLVGVAARP